VKARVDKIIIKYEAVRRRSNGTFEDNFKQLFDVTNFKGEWLSAEDKRLYLLQIETHGKVGYTTEKIADKRTIHPSKRQKIIRIPTETLQLSNDSETSDDTSDENGSSIDRDKDEENKQLLKQRKYSTTSTAVVMVRSGNLTIKKSCKIGQCVKTSGINIPTPSQSGIYKAVFRQAAQLMNWFETSLQNRMWSLHFDGKKLNSTEHQVVVLKNEEDEIRLAVLVLPDSKAATIASALDEVITKYNLWRSIKMIVSDTTNVNTGAKNGVVVRLQRMFKDKNLHIPIFIGCQHHILDRLLRHVCDNYLGSITESPNMAYPFVDSITRNYKLLIDNFQKTLPLDAGHVDETNIKWRDDMKFLHHLVHVFQYYNQHRKMPKVHFRSLPCLSNARWNSRAIFALLAFILMPEMRAVLHDVCQFICGDWSEVWFSDHLYQPMVFRSLEDSVKPYKKALTCLYNHWSQASSPLNIPRSNMCAERAIKVMQELASLCRSPEKLNLRFILSNSELCSKKSND
jgi:hypothetical protein